MLDRVAPGSGSIVVNAGNGYTNAPGGIVTLALSALDAPPAATPNAAVSGVGQMRLANDSTSVLTATALQFNRTATWTLDTPATQGAKTVCVVFIDNAGNESAPVCTQVIYDTIPPASASIAISGPASSGPTFTNSSIVTMALGAVDANGGVGNVNLLVRLSNTPGFAGATYQPFQSSVTWLLPPGDGSKTVYAQYLDPAGTASVVVSASITLDTVAPASPRLTLTPTAKPPPAQTPDPRDPPLTTDPSPAAPAASSNQTLAIADPAAWADPPSSSHAPVQAETA